MSPEPARPSWRTRLPIVVVVLACVAGVTAAVTGAANPLAAVNFLMPGHWVFNGDLQMAFHVDGSTGEVDAQASVPGDPGSQVYQGDTSGYVVGDDRITEFGKSSLEVESTSEVEADTDELPIGLEVAGGPYLVYREIGKIVRLGKKPLSIDIGGPVGDPVTTRDGTVWLPRPSAGFLCELRPKATATSCRVLLPEGNQGGMTVVDDKPMFVDTTADTLHAVEPDRLGAGRELGIDAPDTARLASTDVAGRVAILDGNTMHLVDSGVGSAAAPAPPSKVDLPPGDYDGPVSTGSAVALVDRDTDTLITYDSRGERKESKEIPPENGDPRLTLGEDDRIYVDGAEGEHVLVVDEDGSVTDVPLVEDPQAPSPGDQPELGSDRPEAPPVSDQPPVAAGSPPVQDREPPPDTERREPPREEEPEVPELPVEPSPPPPVVPASPPGAPTAVSAVAGDASATVNWGPAPDNRAPITGYTVSWPGGSLPVGPVGTASIPGLANGTSYVFTVTATNAAGTGPGASSGPVTPVAPGPPPSVDFSRGGTDGCADGDCWWLIVTLSHFTPNVSFSLTVISTQSGVVGGSLTLTTDANGSATLEDVDFDAPNREEIRLRVDGPGGSWESNRMVWDPSDPEAPVDPAVSLSQGPPTEEYCGALPGCSWMHVVLTGFPPNARIFVDPDSTEPSYTNGGHAFTTDENGYAEGDVFAYAGVGETVHVNAHLDGDGEENGGPGIRSNNVTWVQQ